MFAPKQSFKSEQLYWKFDNVVRWNPLLCLASTYTFSEAKTKLRTSVVGENDKVSSFVYLNAFALQRKKESLSKDQKYKEDSLVKHLL